MTFRDSLPDRARRYLPVVAASLLFLAIAAAVAYQGSPLGHDESVYGLRARDFLAGEEPIFYWGPYRAPAFPLVLTLAWLGNGTEPYLRMVTASFGVLLIGSTWFVGRRMLGNVEAAVASFGLAMTPIVLRAATQVWPDVPGAALGMAAVAVYVYFLDRERASAWMLVVPVIAFTATMFRFGAPAAIAVSLVGVTLWRWRVAWASKFLVGATGLLTLVLMYAVLYVPAITGWAQAGTPTAPATSRPRFFRDPEFPRWGTFAEYWGLRRGFLIGFVIVILFAGLVLALIAMRNRRWTRGVVTSLGIAGTTTVVLALTVHAEARYLTPVMPWLWVAASAGLTMAALWGASMFRRLELSHRSKSLLLFGSAVVGVVLMSLVVVDTFDQANFSNEQNRRSFTHIKASSVELDLITEDGACAALSGHGPQVGWYSKCPTMRFNLTRVVVDSKNFPDGPRFLVLIEGGKRQPTGELLDEYLATTAEPPVITSGDPGAGRRQYAEIRVITSDP